ncbi:MAG TPA: TetR family transcriptional regulator [Solirubrobacteraceae bacterium]|nr:TetR family transcriptional regulator [Solirubrobacteraceae bacterium]
MAEIQRARMLAALVDVVAEHGAANLTVTHVVARSGVSRRTFYEIFEDREDCLLAALENAVARLARGVQDAYQQPGSWRGRIRAALCVLLELLDDDPDIARLLIVESLAAGPSALAYREQVLAPIIAVVDEGRAEAKRGNGPPPLMAASVVGGVLSVLHSRLLADALGSRSVDKSGSRTTGPSSVPRSGLVELTSSLMSMIVLPYLGQAAAQKEMERPVPVRQDAPRERFKDPLGDLDMRLTYRTVRVLAAVATNPASSNRQLGQAAGIEDQGQISKLLARLRKLGLIENADTDLGKGAPNAWTLTTRGQGVMQTVSES